MARNKTGKSKRRTVGVSLRCGKNEARPTARPATYTRFKVVTELGGAVRGSSVWLLVMPVTHDASDKKSCVPGVTCRSYTWAMEHA